MPELIAPTADLHAAWLRAHREWGPGPHEDGFGLEPTDEVESPAGFAAWLARMAEESFPGGGPGEAARPVCVYRWIVEDGQVLGGIALRHGHDDHIMQFGHIGYGIRPSARRRGLAGWALGRMLGEAWKLGMDRVLLVCERDNLASARTIERIGGVFEGMGETEDGPVRRYWFRLPPVALPGTGGRTPRRGAV
ncbi:GNAT family N-acetyltransferase [Streptomyces fragilis]|uniref:GNAT family N-acetyltransferase n=1 Tax=Streptomyces fragilis TaxID=67301 RepID=A0ABV2YPE5_9ACTN|nr:GNAT family N-acetyltransferase [Streptomyces fragilis]